MPITESSPSQFPQKRWLNRTVLGAGLTSLTSDWSHEIATSLLPALLLSIGAGPAWLGAIEGAADGISSITKLAAGHWTDQMRRRKPLIVTAYAFTAAATGALAFATGAYHIMAARCTAWLARGVRTPAKKALLAAAVPREAYGRAFGFERMMDTLGAILAPLTALWLLSATRHNYRHALLWTLLPGMLAAVFFGLLVREQVASPRRQVAFFTSLKNLPVRFRWFLLAVGVFGLGDFSHTLMILYATRALTPSLGLAQASSTALVLYLLHNVCYSAAAYFGGWLGDRVAQRKFILAGGYAVALAMAALLAAAPSKRWSLALVFALGGMFVGVVEALEDSLTAELAPREQHGMAFGTVAAVNAIGDFGSSLLVGALWSAYSPSTGFAVAGSLFLAGLILLLKLR